MPSSFFVNNGGTTAARSTIADDLTASSNSKSDAQKLAINAEDAQFTLSDGTTTGNSALHYSAKAAASATSASGSASTATQQAGLANDAKLDAQTAKAEAVVAFGDSVQLTGDQTIAGAKTFSSSIDVTGTVTADGLTVDGTATLSQSTQPILYIKETDTTNLDTRLMLSGGKFYYSTVNNDNSLVSDRLTIDNASGNVLVGGTSVSPATDDFAGIKLSATGAIQASVDGNAALFVNRKGAGNGTAVDFRKQGGQVGTISVTASSTAYNTSSDYRLKTDAQPMTGATDRLKQLNPVNFQWIADGTRVDGFLAHEAQAVVPESVTGTKDAIKPETYEVTPAVVDADGNEITPAVLGVHDVPDYQGIDQAKLVPLLVATIQELEARITALEA